MLAKANPKKKRVENESLLEQIRSRPCVVCNRKGPSDPSHIKTVGSGGGDTDYNVCAMCRKHHSEWHQFGPSKFFERYPHFRDHLIMLGWEILPKLYHPLNPKN